jgi:hypothetical protein
MPKSPSKQLISPPELPKAVNNPVKQSNPSKAPKENPKPKKADPIKPEAGDNPDDVHEKKPEPKSSA